MNMISQLQPKTYFLDTTNSYGFGFSNKRQWGLIAQDVLDVEPELVSSNFKAAEYDSLNNIVSDSVTYLALNYNALFGIILKGIQEQNARLEAQDERIDSLTNALSSCCYSNFANPDGNNNGNGNSNLNKINVTLSSKTIVLNQNVPNPFKEQTFIEYFIPDDATDVKIVFTDSKGSVIKEVEILEKGKGQLNVYASDLSSGIYTYTIVANGISIDSKRMMKTK